MRVLCVPVVVSQACENHCLSDGEELWSTCRPCLDQGLTSHREVMPRVVGRWCTTAAIDVSALMSALDPIIGAGIYDHRRALETSEVGNLNATVHWAHQLQAFFNCLHTELSTATPHKLTDLHSCGKAMLAELLHNPVRARLPTEHRRACDQLAHIVRQIAALLARSQADSLAHQGPRAHYVLCAGASLGFAARRGPHIHPPPALFLSTQISEMYV